MQDIFKPIENSRAVWLGALSLAVAIGAGLMRWMTLGMIAGVVLVGCCGVIAEMQIKILKDHIEKLEDRVDKLEGRIK